VLVWAANAAPDVQYVAVYRSSNQNFVPSAATYIGQSPVNVLGYTDNAGGANDWYRLAAVDQSAASSGFGPAVKPTGIVDAPPQAATRFALHPNEPNPFNPTTLLRYDLTQASQVYLGIYDSTGRLVRVLVSSFRPAGRHLAPWDGRDDAGQTVASGIYIARLDAQHEHATRKMVMVR
jgi:hypothetical protein